VIFVTIGSMFPFDRLIQKMDEWAAETKRDDVFAQIGNGKYQPKHMGFVRRFSQSDFSEMVTKSRVVVAHAGMGTVISAGCAGRPLVVLPRIERWGEHTTDHQIATANWLKSKPGIIVADMDTELPNAIEQALEMEISREEQLPEVADSGFTDKLHSTIQEFLTTRKNGTNT